MVPSLASGSTACVCECCVHLHCHHIYQTFYLVEKHSDLDLFIQFIQWNFQKHGPYDQNSWQCMIMSATYVSADLKTVEMLYLFTLQLSISWGFNLQSCVLMTLCSWSAFFLGPKTTLVRRLCLSLVLLLQKKKKNGWEFVSTSHQKDPAFVATNTAECPHVFVLVFPFLQCFIKVHNDRTSSFPQKTLLLNTSSAVSCDQFVTSHYNTESHICIQT